MKKITAVAMLTALVLGLSSVCFAGYMKGFRVVEVSGDRITIRKGKEEPIMLPRGKMKFKAGDEVSFNQDNLKLRKKFEGC